VLYCFIIWLRKIYSDDPQENNRPRNRQQQYQHQQEHQPEDHESVDLEEDRERDRQQYLESVNLLNDYCMVNDSDQD